MFITRSVKTLFHKFPSYSYGKFVYENPNASRKERRIALKKFLDSTRNMPKSINNKKNDEKKK
jgi:hypothetical protein